MAGKVYLIPTVLHSDEKALQALPAYIVNAIKDCSVFFAENEKTARRFFKKIWKEIVIDNYKWFSIHKTEASLLREFAAYLTEGRNVGIISEAGCPGIADPGQQLIHLAQEKNFTIIPLVGPSAILLSLMASGMNGQCFQFNGYLPVESSARKNALKEMEIYSRRKNCTQIFIETPYRNNQLLLDILAVCDINTLLCIATELTSSAEKITTQKISEWKKNIPPLHKKPAIFLLLATVLHTKN